MPADQTFPGDRLPMRRLLAAVALASATFLTACSDSGRPLHELVLVSPDIAGGESALVRYNTLTGETFVSTRGRNWRPVRDEVIVGTSSYRVVGTYEQGLLVVVRLDENTGRSWRLDKNKWTEIPVGGDKETKDKEAATDAAPAAEAAAGEAAPAGDAADNEATGEKGEKRKLTEEEKAAKKAAKKAEKQRLKEQEAGG